MKTEATMLAAAGALLALYGALEALGLRDWVSVLSGTPAPGVPIEQAMAGGALYVLAYFGAVLGAPILTLAAAVGAVGGWLLRRARSAVSPLSAPARQPGRASRHGSGA